MNLVTPLTGHRSVHYTVIMRTATFSEFRNQAKKYFDAVESGESVEIYRHGKPVAVLTPIRKQSLDRWRSARPLTLSGASLSRAILAEREDGR
jgi:prevent-host-death family protein